MDLASLKAKTCQFGKYFNPQFTRADMGKKQYWEYGTNSIKYKFEYIYIAYIALVIQ